MKGIQSLNLFPQTSLTYSKSGIRGCLFLLTVILCILLITYEILVKEESIHLTIEQVDDDHRIEVFLNLTVMMPCAALQLDIMDMTGLSLRDVKHTIQYLRINNNEISAPRHIGKFRTNSSCYGAEIIEDQRCLSCQDVMIAYSQRRWTLPNWESIEQCVSEEMPVVEFDTYQIEYYKLLQEQEEETLASVRDKLSTMNITDVIQEDKDSNETQPLKEMMTAEQKSKFKQALSELSEITYNPMQWDEKRLKEEKVSRVDSLINMLNISLDNIGNSLGAQIRFADRERVISAKNLSLERTSITELYRQKCADHIKITLQLNDTQEVEVEMISQQCGIQIEYETKEEVDKYQLTLYIDKHVIEWNIFKNVMLVNSYTLHMTKVVVINKEFNYTYTPQGMFDKAYGQFRMNVYVPVQNIKREQQPRLLFTDSFQVEQQNESFVLEEQVVLVQEHINEGCQLHGYFYLKRVPGKFTIRARNNVLQYINHTFSQEHTLNKLQFNGGNSIPQSYNSSATYYLKLVSTTTQSKQYYQYTLQKAINNEEKELMLQFNYEFDPISMIIQEKEILNCVISIFAIIGGVLAVSKYISSFV